MLVSASTGRALSQKRYPRMALIRPRIDLDRGELVVEANGMPALRLPLVLESDDNFCHAASTTAGADSTESDFPPTPPLSEEESSDSGANTTRSSPPSQPQMTNLCGSSVASIGVSAAADAWFTAFLNPASSSSSAFTSDSSTKSTTTHASIPRRDAAGPGPVELHRLPNGSARHAHFDRLGAAAAGPPLPLRLSNESPFLLVSEESLGALNEWISEGNDTAARSSSTRDESPAPIRAHSFRPNLVVGNGDSTLRPLAPFWEERIDQFSISRDGLDGSPQSFSTLGKCRRCLMVAIDQVCVALSQSLREIPETHDEYTTPEHGRTDCRTASDVDPTQEGGGYGSRRVRDALHVARAGRCCRGAGEHQRRRLGHFHTLRLRP
jgi:molybdenum cofactor sulfurtransferase